MAKPNLNQPPEDSAEAVNRRLHAAWLRDSLTQKFFRALEKQQIDELKSAAAHSEMTAIDNAKEHNKLVRANAIRQIIQRYNNRTEYPYASIDTIDRNSPSPEPIPIEQRH